MIHIPCQRGPPRQGRRARAGVTHRRHACASPTSRALAPRKERSRDLGTNPGPTHPWYTPSFPPTFSTPHLPIAYQRGHRAGDRSRWRKERPAFAQSQQGRDQRFARCPLGEKEGEGEGERQGERRIIRQHNLLPISPSLPASIHTDDGWATPVMML